MAFDSRFVTNSALLSWNEFTTFSVEGHNKSQDEAHSHGDLLLG